jgi:hypothetical protein
MIGKLGNDDLRECAQRPLEEAARENVLAPLVAAIMRPACGRPWI